jgi:hypothetical protein
VVTKPLTHHPAGVADWLIFSSLICRPATYQKFLLFVFNDLDFGTVPAV